MIFFADIDFADVCRGWFTDCGLFRSLPLPPQCVQTFSCVCRSDFRLDRAESLAKLEIASFVYSTQLKGEESEDYRLRELAPAARGSQDAGSRNIVFTFQMSTVHFGSKFQLPRLFVITGSPP